MGAGSWETSWISFLVMKTSPLEKLWSASHIPTPHFIWWVRSFSSLRLLKKEQINQQNMTQESVSFAEVATYVRKNCLLFFSVQNFYFVPAVNKRTKRVFRLMSHNVAQCDNTTPEIKSRTQYWHALALPLPYITMFFIFIILSLVHLFIIFVFVVVYCLSILLPLIEIHCILYFFVHSMKLP